jgi:hypothetical protein
MDPIVAELLKYGMGGIFIAYLVYSNYLLRKSFDDQQSKNEALQERRMEERDRMASTLSATNDALRNLTAVAHEHQRAVSAMAEKIGGLTAIILNRRGR